MRPIGGDPTQLVHPTARDRFDSKQSYAPENLAAYLDGSGPRIYGEDGGCTAWMLRRNLQTLRRTA